MRACERRHRRTASEPRERRGMTDQREVRPRHISKLKDVFAFPAACLHCRIDTVQKPFRYRSSAVQMLFGRYCKGFPHSSPACRSSPPRRSRRPRKRPWRCLPLLCPDSPSWRAGCGLFSSPCATLPQGRFPRTATVRAVAPAVCGMNCPCRGLNAYVKVGYKRECGYRLYCHRHLSLFRRAIRWPLLQGGNVLSGIPAAY